VLVRLHNILQVFIAIVSHANRGIKKLVWEAQLLVHVISIRQDVLGLLARYVTLYAETQANSDQGLQIIYAQSVRHGRKLN
jgi:hypothetical protein